MIKKTRTAKKKRGFNNHDTKKIYNKFKKMEKDNLRHSH